MNIASIATTIASLFGKRREADEPDPPPYPRVRDPQGDAGRYREYLRPLRQNRRTLLVGLEKLKPEIRLLRRNLSITNDIRYLYYQYAAGAGLVELAGEAAQCVADLDRNSQYLREHGGEPYRTVHALIGHHREAVAFAAIALLLVPDAGAARTFHRLLSPDGGNRIQMLDVLVKAFDPAQTVARRYPRNGFSKPWSDPVLRALALPAERRAAALATHMQDWTRLMRGYGWKPRLDTASGRDPLFSDFAFEVALAVCGWDIDDAAFADHPYYPRDLVQHYRAHLRHARDAWRAEGIGAGIAIDAPPPPARGDLARSRRKGFARWLELVSDGDQAATDDALETAQAPRSDDPDDMGDLHALLEALQHIGIALHADNKDDDSVAAAIHDLGDARGLGEFAEPAEPPAGIARCEALLRAWSEWLAARGYRFAPIDLRDDAWHAVVVRSEYLDELRALSERLRIPLVEPSAVLGA